MNLQFIENRFAIIGGATRKITYPSRPCSFLQFPALIFLPFCPGCLLSVYNNL